MINKLRQNYNISNILATVAFALTYAFAKWFNFTSVSSIFIGNSNIMVVVLAALLSGFIFAVILPYAINLVLNIARINFVPRAEYSLLAKLFFSATYLVCGLLNLLRFLSPFFAVWGEMLVFAVTTTIAVFSFYSVTAKLYFNNNSRVYYFRLIVIVYIVVMLLGGYIL